MALQPSGLRWFVGTVRGGCADIAKLHLKRQIPDVLDEVYSPEVAEERLEGRQRKRTIRNLKLYPGYIFVRMDLDFHMWRSFNGTVGCGKLLGSNADCPPLALPVGFVEELQGLELRGELTQVRADAVQHRYSKNQPVHVVSGAWKDHHAAFSRYRKGALVLFMTLFSQEVELEFKPHEVEPASPRAA